MEEIYRIRGSRQKLLSLFNRRILNHLPHNNNIRFVPESIILMNSRSLPHDKRMGRFMEVMCRVKRASFFVDRTLLAREQLTEREQLRLHARPVEGLHVGDRDRGLVGPQVSLKILHWLARRPVFREHDGTDAVINNAENFFDLVDAEVVAVIG